MIYRSTGGENRKSRPAFYSKLGSLRSLLRAWHACDARGDLVFLNDGPMAADRLEVMEAEGIVVPLPGLGLQDAYRRALEEPARRGWPDGDLVYLAEDDYLYRRESLSELAAVARQLPDVDYFALVGTPRGLRRGDHPGLDEIGFRLPRVPAEWPADGWRTGLSCTASFAARPAALRRDRTIFDVALRGGATWDHTSASAYQGLWPYTLREVLGPLGDTDKNPSRRAKLTLWRLTLGAISLARRRDPHTLVIADPALATHVESGWLSPGTDWEAEAAA